MPLGCDCYPGCWHDHSKNWPDLIFTEARWDYLINRRDLCGSFVMDGINGGIRVETYKILFDVLQATESPPPKAQPEPVVDDDPNRLSLDNYQRMY